MWTFSNLTYASYCTERASNYFLLASRATTLDINFWFDPADDDFPCRPLVEKAKARILGEQFHVDAMLLKQGARGLLDLVLTDTGFIVKPSSLNVP